MSLCFVAVALLFVEKVVALHDFGRRAARVRVKGFDEDVLIPQNSTEIDAGWNTSSFRETSHLANYGHPPWLQDCTKIYLDIGTNIGVQIRKLFEPEKYPLGRVLPIFTDVFGDGKYRAHSVCALGMEPNPHHWARLQALEAAYGKRGFRTHIYHFAAWKKEGTMAFRTDKKDVSSEQDVANSMHEEWGAHLRREVVQVRTVDLAAFIKSLPHGKVKLMKLDIEGAEYETLANAIPQSVMCEDTVPKLCVETHPRGDITTWKDDRLLWAVARRIKDHTCEGSRPTSIVDRDDETYVHDVDDDFSR